MQWEASCGALAGFDGAGEEVEREDLHFRGMMGVRNTRIAVCLNLNILFRN